MAVTPLSFFLQISSPEVPKEVMSSRSS